MARPAKPIHQHLADKTFRADRHGRRLAELDAVRSNGRLSTEPPECLNALGADLWTELTRKMPEYLDSLDARNLFALCRWWQAYCRAMDLADEEPENYKALQVAVMAWKQFSSLADLFGLSPSSREKLGLVWCPPPDADD